MVMEMEMAMVMVLVMAMAMVMDMDMTKVLQSSRWRKDLWLMKPTKRVRTT